MWAIAGIRRRTGKKQNVCTCVSMCKRFEEEEEEEEEEGRGVVRIQ